jgi:heme-degrading monooxygenase HmoA
MYARMHTLETSPEAHDRGLELVRDQLLPWLRDSTGFRGLIRLANREAGKTLVVTLWADEESLRASADAAEQLTDLATITSGATRRGLDEFDVTFFDVRP